MNAIEQLKKKRFNLTSGLPDQQRLSSAERRRKIQTSLQDFKRQMRPKIPLKKVNQTHEGFNRNINNKNEDEQLSRTPTMKDISFAKIKQNFQIAQEQKKAPQQEIQKQQEFNEERIDGIQKQEQEQKLQEKEDIEMSGQDKHVTFKDQPEQFSRELSQKQLQQKIDIQPVVIQSKVEEIAQQDVQKMTQQERRQAQMTPIKQLSEPTYKNPQSGLNFNYNDSHYGSSSNNSSAIFFTSQFKDYFNKEKQVQKFQTIEQKEAQTIKQEEEVPRYSSKQSELGSSYLKLGDQEASEGSKKMGKNKSGDLALSHNQSSLRYSFVNQSGVHEIINKKLDEELVLQIHHFSRDKFTNFISTLYTINKHKFFKEFRHIFKVIKFQKGIEFNLKRQCFDGFLILRQYKFEQVKNNIKVENFIKEHQDKTLKNCFRHWKKVKEDNELIADHYRQKKDLDIKANIFKVFKMYWYDAKVARQVELYYLSKIFTSWKTTAQREKKKNNNIALSIYAKNLRKNYFYYLMEGIDKIRRERQNAEMAEYFHETTLMRRAMQAWKQRSNREPRYISLTMTSKNTFYETKNNKWLQTKTVDFRQLK